jgi:hypothetical protein
MRQLVRYSSGGLPTSSRNLSAKALRAFETAIWQPHGH